MRPESTFNSMKTTESAVKDIKIQAKPWVKTKSNKDNALYCLPHHNVFVKRGQVRYKEAQDYRLRQIIRPKRVPSSIEVKKNCE